MSGLTQLLVVLLVTAEFAPVVKSCFQMLRTPELWSCHTAVFPEMAAFCCEPLAGAILTAVPALQAQMAGRSRSSSHTTRAPLIAGSTWECVSLLSFVSTPFVRSKE